MGDGSGSCTMRTMLSSDCVTVVDSGWWPVDVGCGVAATSGGRWLVAAGRRGGDVAVRARVSTLLVL